MIQKKNWVILVKFVIVEAFLVIWPYKINKIIINKTDKINNILMTVAYLFSEIVPVYVN